MRSNIHRKSEATPNIGGKSEREELSKVISYVRNSCIPLNTATSKGELGTNLEQIQPPNDA